MPIFANNFVTSDDAIGGSVIEKSLRFRGSQYFNRSPSGDGNRRTFTLSLWIKRGTLGEHYILDSFQDDNNRTRIGIEAGNGMQVTNRVGGSTTQLTSSQKLKDFGGWYHLVFAFDTTQASSSNRIKYYLNGVLDTNVSGSYPSQNGVTFVNHSGDNHTIGVGQDSGGLEQYFKGYIAEMHLIDGVQLDASYFGYTEDQTGIWRPKRYTYGNYGTHGFYLDFLNASGTTATTLGRDKSGNPNNFTPNNFSVSAGNSNDSSVDTPSNNFPTWNPLNTSKQNGGATSYSFGNLKLNTTTGSAGSLYPFGFTTFGATSGKWYAEFVSDTSNHAVGIANLGQLDSDVSNNPYGAYANTSFIYTNSGEIRTNDANLTNQTSYGSGDIIGVAMDLDNMKLYFHKNGTYINSGNPSTGSNGYTIGALPSDKTGDYVFSCGSNGASSVGVFANLGQIKTASTSYADSNGIGSFDYAVPTGFRALCTANLLPNVPSIIRPQKHFDTLLYTATGNAMTVTGLEFKPDFVWQKRRDATSGSHFHYWFDIIRGGRQILQSNTSSGDSDAGDDNNFVFKDGGFDMIASTGGQGNASGGTYAAWCWKAGGAAVSNSDGAITSSVSVNDEAGFSIVSYSGNGNSTATIGHGLSKAPKWIITKCRSTSTHADWVVWHERLSDNKNLYLNQQNAEGTPSYGHITNPTSTLINVSKGSGNQTNASGETYISYCWSEIPGYSKFDSYIGNGNSDGTFVHLGFRPAWLMVKNADSGSTDWIIYDVLRETYNPMYRRLAANQPNAEGSDTSTSAKYDLLSNGFKSVGGDGTFANTNGETYIYMAFAEQPGTTPFDTFTNAR